MSAWVLIIAFMLADGSGITSIEFATGQACMAAAEDFAANMRHQAPAVSWPFIVYTCSQSGATE